MSFRIRFRTGWTGKIDGEQQKVEPGEERDVDIATAQALCFQYQIAELVPIEEIIKTVKELEVKEKKPRASRTKAQTKPEKDKMVRTSTTKGE